MAVRWFTVGLGLVLLSGCLGGSSDEKSRGSTLGNHDKEAGNFFGGGGQGSRAVEVPPSAYVPPEAEPLPDDIHAEQDVLLGTGMPLAMGDRCEFDPSSCYRYPFQLTEGMFVYPEYAANINVSMNWSIPVNDFDVYLFEDGYQVWTSAGPVPQTSEAFDWLTYEDGEFEVLVVAYLTAADTFQLDVKFSRPE